MNDNEYGKIPFYRTDDGKKEMRISDKESLTDLIAKLRESASDPDAEHIDQIRIIDEESGVTKRIIYPNYSPQNPQKNETKRTSSSIGFIIAVVAFMAAVVIFLLIASYAS